MQDIVRQDGQSVFQNISENLAYIQDCMAQAAQSAGRSMQDIDLIAVSKYQPMAAINAACQLGLKHFGENHAQEAVAHWGLREDVPGTQRGTKIVQDIARPTVHRPTIHMIGALQRNKVAMVLDCCDVIHSVDRDNLARKLGQEMQRRDHFLPCLIQVNIGEEPQKSGIAPRDFPEFLQRCREEYGLPVKGVMAIPPHEECPAPYFALLAKIADRYQLAWRSMGMSADFAQAIAYGATHIRVGTALFGSRQNTT